VGASAGLNLLLDHYAYRGDSWQFGSADSTVQFIDPIEGPVQLEHFMITDRAGCDLRPVDATTTEGRLLLTSFVWPFDQRLWNPGSGGSIRERSLGIANDHGIPVTLASS
jgi:hypothetical protein